MRSRNMMTIYRERLFFVDPLVREITGSMFSSQTPKTYNNNLSSDPKWPRSGHAYEDKILFKHGMYMWWCKYECANMDNTEYPVIPVARNWTTVNWPIGFKAPFLQRLRFPCSPLEHISDEAVADACVAFKEVELQRRVRQGSGKGML